MRAILDRVSPAATLVEALEPLHSDPRRAAVLLDIDGTLAPIVRHAADAHVPEATRGLLIAVARRFGVVACVSGRGAAAARPRVRRARDDERAHAHTDSLRGQGGDRRLPLAWRARRGRGGGGGAG